MYIDNLDLLDLVQVATQISLFDFILLARPGCFCSVGLSCNINFRPPSVLLYLLKSETKYLKYIYFIIYMLLKVFN